MILPSNTDLVDLCARIYASDVTSSEWNHLDLGLDDGVFWAVKKYFDYVVVVFRGSITVQDWIRDMMSAPILTPIGWVHGGFYLGTERVWAELRPLLHALTPVVVVGHSLGASHANMLCGHMIKDGVIPAKRMVVGEPRPGLQDFCDHLKIIPSQFSFVNSSGGRHDMVTDVPFSLPAGLPFARPTPLIPVSASPTGNLWQRDFDPFALHHITLYQAAVAAYETLPKQGAAA